MSGHVLRNLPLRPELKSEGSEMGPTSKTHPKRTSRREDHCSRAGWRRDYIRRRGRVCAGSRSAADSGWCHHEHGDGRRWRIVCHSTVPRSRMGCRVRVPKHRTRQLATTRIPTTGWMDAPEYGRRKAGSGVSEQNDHRQCNVGGSCLL